MFRTMSALITFVTNRTLPFNMNLFTGQENESVNAYYRVPDVGVVKAGAIGVKSNQRITQYFTVAVSFGLTVKVKSYFESKLDKACKKCLV